MGKIVTNDLPVRLRARSDRQPNIGQHGRDLYYLLREAADHIDALRSRLKLAEDVCKAVDFYAKEERGGRDNIPDSVWNPYQAWRSARDAKPKEGG